MVARALLATVCVCCTLVPGAGSAAALPGPGSTPGARVLVGYTGQGLAGADGLERALGASRLARIDQLGVDVLELPSAGLGASLAALRADPRVRYAELDGRVSASRVPNDQLLSSQWSLATTHAEQAWDFTTGSPAVVVAVIDTGVDSAQPDLQGKLVPGYDFVNGTANPSDDNGHGTAVAGIIAANSDNRIGIAGYCWQCRLMPVKALGADGSGYDSAIAQAIVWATDNGARVLNLSLGGPTDDLTLASATQYAWAYGALVVAAAGNDSSSLLDYPAALPNVVSVAASDQSDHLYSFSNSGALLAAPGENTSTAPGAGYVSFLGTSSAAPVVSGIAGLAFSLAASASPLQIEQALEAGAVPISGVACGRVDAYGTLRALGARPTAPSTASPARGGGAGAQRGSATGSPARQTTLVAGRLRRGQDERSFRFRAASGLLRASVVLAGRSHALVRLRLVGPTNASSRGRGRAELRLTVKGGSYRLVVRVRTNGAVRFRLTLAYARR
ncbi:MAG TPA: S8 family peptidase [Gaiellaceae bacterium]